MAAVILDACATVNLYASGRFVPILQALPYEWYMPVAVADEAQHFRQPEPGNPEQLIAAPIDLTLAFGSGVLKSCDCEGEVETALYVELAACIGDDGESMGLAIAKCRGWSVLTDDKKARRIAQELAVPVLATPEVMQQWAVATGPSPGELAQMLEAIKRFANYRPSRSAVAYEWWAASMRPGEA